MAKKVKVDKDLCIGCGTCVAICPMVFSMDENGKSIVSKKDGTKTHEFVDIAETNGTEELVQNAADSCPTRAILVE